MTDLLTPTRLFLACLAALAPFAVPSAGPAQPLGSTAGTAPMVTPAPSIPESALTDDQCAPSAPPISITDAGGALSDGLQPPPSRCMSQSCGYCAEGPTEVNAVAVSADGSRVVSGGSKGSVVLYEENYGHIVWDDSTLCSKVRSVAISADGAYFAAGTTWGVCLFHVSSDAPVIDYTTGSPVNAVAISADGRYLAAGAENGEVLRLRAGSSTPVFTYTAGGAVRAVALTPDGDYIAAGTDAGEILLFQTSCGTPRRYAPGGRIVAVALSDDASHVAGGDGAGIVHLLGPSLSLLQRYDAGGGLSTLSMTSAGGTIVTANDCEAVRCFSASSPDPLWGRALIDEGGIAYAAVSADGSRVAACGSTSVQFLDPSTGAVVARRDMDVISLGVGISSDGARAVVRTMDDNVHLFSTAHSSPRWTSRPSYRCDAGDVRDVSGAEISYAGYYDDDGYFRRGRISPFKEIIVRGRDLDAGELRLFWGAALDHYEWAYVLSREDDHEVRAIVSAMADNYFIPSDEPLYLGVYNEIDCATGCMRLYPVALDPMSYVVEATEHPFVGGPFVSGPFLAPLDLSTPDALLVTRVAVGCQYAARLARLHTVTGTSVEVADLDDIRALGYGIAGDDDVSTARGLKEYLRDRYEDSDGVTCRLVIANPAESEHLNIIPAFAVTDGYSPLSPKKVASTFSSDFYYADLSEWDSNGDGVHDEDNGDDPIDYRASVGVSRIPFGEDAISRRYVEKVLEHLTAYDTDRIGETLLLSNTATSFEIAGLPLASIDSGWWLATCTAAQMPSSWNVYSLFESDGYTPEDEAAALEDGFDLVIHMGHGSDTKLTCNDTDTTMDFTDAMAYALENPGRYPIMISGACEAGSLQAGYAAAGAQLIAAPFGGAVAYVGNSTYGTSLMGNCQFIDAMVAGMRDAASATDAPPTLSDLFLEGLANFTSLPESVVIPFNNAAEEYTMESVVLLGDGLLPVYTRPLDEAPSLGCTKFRCRNRTTGATVARFAFTVSPDYADGVITLHTEGGNYYSVETGGKGSCSMLIEENPLRIAAGYRSASCLNAYREVYYREGGSGAVLRSTATPAPTAGIFTTVWTPTPTPISGRTIPVGTPTPTPLVKTIASAP